MHGEKISQEITSGQVKYDFDSVTTLHSGNPLALGQNPITFNREVLSVMMNPNLINFPGCVSSDAVARAQLYTSKLEVPIGSYSDCRGFSFCREKIS